MPPSRQRRSIASPDAGDFNETSVEPSDAPHVTSPSTRVFARRLPAGGGFIYCSRLVQSPPRVAPAAR